MIPHGAMQQEAFATWLQETSLAQLGQGSMVPAVHEKGLDWLRQYCLIGGMPEAIAQFVEHGDFKTVARIQQGIVVTYRDDFGKFSHGTLKARMQLVFDRLPTMVGRKFKYVQVSADHRAGEIATALQQLCMARVAYKVPHTAANGVPLSAETNPRHFKTLCMDVGLMCRTLHLDLADMTQTDLTLINSGAVAEQFVGQHLLYSGAPYDEPTLNYWMREGRNASAELDYVLAHGQNIVPVEIKAGKAGTMRSLHYFLKEKQRHFGLRFNTDAPSLLRAAPLTIESTVLQCDLLSLPLYMVGQTRRLLADSTFNPPSRPWSCSGQVQMSHPSPVVRLVQVLTCCLPTRKGMTKTDRGTPRRANIDRFFNMAITTTAIIGAITKVSNGTHRERALEFAAAPPQHRRSNASRRSFCMTHR